MNDILSQKISLLERSLSRLKEHFLSFAPAGRCETVFSILSSSLDEVRAQFERMKSILHPQLQEHIIVIVGDIERKLGTLELYFNFIENISEVDKKFYTLVDSIISDISILESTISKRFIIKTANLYSTIQPQYGLTEQIYLFLLPSFDRWSLLSYPILAHELGHNVLYLYEDHFFEKFNQSLINLDDKMRRDLISLTRNRREEQERLHERLLHSWGLWKNEIGADIIGLYLLGPAFAYSSLNSFVGPNPYEIFSTHPPHNLRINLLTKYLSSSVFNLAEVAREMQAKWDDYLGVGNFRKDPRYEFLANVELAFQCAESVSAGCIEFGIGPFGHEEIASLESFRKIDIGSLLLENGRQLLNLAWIKFQKDKPAYYQWEQSVLEQII